MFSSQKWVFGELSATGSRRRNETEKVNDGSRVRVIWLGSNCGGCSSIQVLGVVFDVVVHEGVDEEVAVVIALQKETAYSDTDQVLHKYEDQK